MLDWKDLETVLTEESEKALQKWMKRYSVQHPYAFAFHECYSELDGLITIPQLAVNSIEKQSFQDGTADEGWKWNSADWHWLDVFPVRSPLQKLEKLLTQEACRSTQSHWLAT